MDVEAVARPASTSIEAISRSTPQTEPSRFHKAKRLQLSREATTESVVADILVACWSHAMANTAAAFDGREPEGIHQMRVGLRRLRSALVLLKPVLVKEQTRWVTNEVKWINSALGPARDWDVLVTQTLNCVLCDDPDNPNLAVLKRNAKRQRERAYDAVRKMITSDRFEAFRRRYPDWLEERSWQRQNGKSDKLLQRPAVKTASKLLTKRHKKTLRLGDELVGLSGEKLHPLRIELKKLRYAGEFFGSLHDDDGVTLYINALKQLQDDLGHLNDVAVAARLLADLPKSTNNVDTKAALNAGRSALIEWYDNKAADSADALTSDWQRFSHMTPFWR